MYTATPVALAPPAGHGEPAGRGEPAGHAGHAGPAAREAPIPLGLALVRQHEFGPGGPFGWDDHIYFPDLMRSYGMLSRPELFERRRNSFTDMVEAMLARLDRFGDRFDVAILTGVTPDSQPGYPMCRLSELVERPGLAFAIFDQGVVAPFTALRVLAGVVRADHARRAVLLVLEQSSLLHEEPVIERLAVRHDSAVVLVLDEAGQLGSVGLPTSHTVPAGQAGALLDAELRAQWTADGPHRVVVCGFGLAAHLPAGLPADDVIVAGPGRPATGVWVTFAAQLPLWQRTGARVVLADFDDDERRLSLCAVEVWPQAAGEVAA